ncbi:hypothetical protein Sjap_026178 [Stephania japonica]|uniref:Uncharacterized protein n=1 Tax=Stephania japonica TaxID=461633 RepID=A0AAP0HI94_9MAGN
MSFHCTCIGIRLTSEYPDLVEAKHVGYVLSVPPVSPLVVLDLGMDAIEIHAPNLQPPPIPFPCGVFLGQRGPHSVAAKRCGAVYDVGSGRY